MAQTVRMISINLSPLKAWLRHITPNSSPTFQNFDKNLEARRHTLPFVQLRTPVDHNRETSSASWVKHSFRIATCFTGLVSQLHTRRSHCQIAPLLTLPGDTPADLPCAHCCIRSARKRQRDLRN